MTGCSGRCKTGSIDQAKAEHYSTAFPEVYKQAVAPADAINDIAIIEELQDNSVKLVFSEDGRDGSAQLIWYLGGRSASLSQLLPMLQSMGVIVLEERPFTVTRPDGLPVWIYQFKISVLSDIPDEPEGPERDATAVRFADAVTAIWHGRAEIDRFNELVLRARPDVAAGRDSAHLCEVPAAGRFSVQPGPHRGRAQRQPGHRAVAGRTVRGDVRPGGRSRNGRPRRPPPHRWPPTSMR